MHKLALIVAALAATVAPALAGAGNCDALATNSRTATPIPPTALAAVRSIQIVSAGDCTGLFNLTNIDSAGHAALGTKGQLATVMQSRYSGREIIGYQLDGQNLEIYVRD